tara:strand:+ start:209 stop:934 length:726 start_codon:yes stop_codon:yes gene_type:complete
MKKPYFYLIRHISSNKLYAGVKWSDPNSSTFMTEDGYTTSSKVVNAKIKNEGIDAFCVLRIKHFDTPNEARSYESKFLSKVQARTNRMFLNLSENSANFLNKGGYELPETAKEKMRKPKSEKTKEKMRQPKTEEHIKAAVAGRRRNGEWHSDEAKQAIAISQLKRFEDENEKKKISEGVKRWIKETGGLTPEQKEKHREQNTGKNNGMFGKTHSEETSRKMKEAWARRKARKAKLQNEKTN